MKTAIEQAVEIVGSQTKLAEAVHVQQGHVWNWINRSAGRVPGEHCIAISQATEWQIRPHDLRPDIYPHPLDGLPDGMRCAA